jgi:baculoviral IAP repeat-containing protein 6 (apollon)
MIQYIRPYGGMIKEFLMCVSASGSMGIRCTYLPSQDRVIFVSGQAVGARRDLNGVLLLDSALQTTVVKPDDIVCIELPLPEVNWPCCL